MADQGTQEHRTHTHTIMTHTYVPVGRTAVEIQTAVVVQTAAAAAAKGVAHQLQQDSPAAVPILGLPLR